MRNIRTLAPILGISLLLGACANTPPEATYPASGTMTSPATSSSNAAAEAAARAAAARAAAERQAAANAAAANGAITAPAERNIYFGFDEYTISSRDADLLGRHARYLTASPSVAVRVEGHADERGSSEYNLALGQRRAEAVRRALGTLGVSDARIEATSWGESKPAVQGSGEDAWARNRRAELVYPTR